ncbi:hypothetical protein D3C78_1495000 [compost metagenome]
MAVCRRPAATERATSTACWMGRVMERTIQRPSSTEISIASPVATAMFSFKALTSATAATEDDLAAPTW